MPNPAAKVTSWSFSRYSDYKTCPLKFKLKHLDKMKEPPNAAMERGAAIHKMAEDYVKGLLRKLPPELKKFEADFKAARKVYRTAPEQMVVEDNWAFTADWSVTTWHDWVNCWVRIKLDCAQQVSEGVMDVIDYKTGKFRDDKNAEYLEQLELYALSAFLQYPGLTEVRPRLQYLDVGVEYPPRDKPLVYTQEDVPLLKKRWAARVKPMFNDKSFPPKPNNLCRWCWFGQSKKADGGPGLCKY
jgi:putative RecB family exonuclease